MYLSQLIFQAKNLILVKEFNYSKKWNSWTLQTEYMNIAVIFLIFMDKRNNKSRNRTIFLHIIPFIEHLISIKKVVTVIVQIKSFLKTNAINAYFHLCSQHILNSLGRSKAWVYFKAYLFCIGLKEFIIYYYSVDFWIKTPKWKTAFKIYLKTSILLLSKIILISKKKYVLWIVVFLNLVILSNLLLKIQNQMQMDSLKLKPQLETLKLFHLTDN